MIYELSVLKLEEKDKSKDIKVVDFFFKTVYFEAIKTTRFQLRCLDAFMRF